jgi:nuclear pore complex protein Nup54
VPQDQAMLYAKPQGHDPEKWDKAIQDRPDSSSVPVLAIGFNDLQKRVALQESQVAAYRQRMHEINSKLDELTTRHDLYTSVKVQEMKTRHSKLSQRTLSLAVKLQVLRNRGYVLRPEEEVLKNKLEQLSKRIVDPAVFGRINEIWARMSVLREKAMLLKESVNEYGRLSLDWERDDEQLEKLAKVLKAQQTGITYLTKILTADSQKAEEMIKSLEASDQKRRR